MGLMLMDPATGILTPQARVSRRDKASREGIASAILVTETVIAIGTVTVTVTVTVTPGIGNGRSRRKPRRVLPPPRPKHPLPGRDRAVNRKATCGGS